MFAVFQRAVLDNISIVIENAVVLMYRLKVNLSTVQEPGLITVITKNSGLNAIAQGFFKNSTKKIYPHFGLYGDSCRVYAFVYLGDFIDILCFRCVCMFREL